MKKNDGDFGRRVMIALDGRPVDGGITYAAVSTPTGHPLFTIGVPQPAIVEQVGQERNTPSLLHERKLTVPQATRLVGNGQTKLRQILKEGQIPVIRILGKILILERDLENYLQGKYGTLSPAEGTYSRGLPPLPKHIRESALLKELG